ncbi:MAG: PfkB family carbohydrate kinase [Patescibacteria group bacterium]
MKDRLLVVGNLAKDVVDDVETYGGSAANLALAAKRLGLSVGIMSVLGRDGFSNKYRRFLEEQEINLDLTPSVLKELPVCTIVSSENVIASSRWEDNGCHPAMDEMSLDENAINMFGLVHLVSCPPKLANRLSELNVDLSYEPGPMLVEDPTYFDDKVARESTFIFANKEEYEVIKNKINSLFGDNSLKKTLILVVTLGSEGVLLLQGREKPKHISIPPELVVTEVIDSIGAGDNFKAGFLTGFMKGRSVDESVQIGMEMGAECVKQKGGLLLESKVSKIKLKYNL